LSFEMAANATKLDLTLISRRRTRFKGRGRLPGEPIKGWTRATRTTLPVQPKPATWTPGQNR